MMLFQCCWEGNQQKKKTWPSKCEGQTNSHGLCTAGENSSLGMLKDKKKTIENERIFLHLILFQWTHRKAMVTRFKKLNPPIILKIDSTNSLSVPVSYCKRSVLFSRGSGNNTLCISNAKLKDLKDLRYTAVVSHNHTKKVITNLHYDFKG
jgi:hypothetical protein